MGWHGMGWDGVGWGGMGWDAVLSNYLAAYHNGNSVILSISHSPYVATSRLLSLVMAVALGRCAVPNVKSKVLALEAV